MGAVSKKVPLCRNYLHPMVPENLKPNGPRLFRCRECHRVSRRLSDSKRRRGVPNVDPVVTLGLYEDYLVLKSRGSSEEAAARDLGVSKGSLYRTKVKYGPIKGD